MSLYICTDCGATFDEPKEVTETHGLETPPYEKLLVCPECLSSDYDTAVMCGRCKTAVPSAGCYFVDNTHYCTKCFATLDLTDKLKPSDYDFNE